MWHHLKMLKTTAPKNSTTKTTAHTQRILG